MADLSDEPRPSPTVTILGNGQLAWLLGLACDDLGIPYEIDGEGDIVTFDKETIDPHVLDRLNTPEARTVRLLQDKLRARQHFTCPQPRFFEAAVHKTGAYDGRGVQFIHGLVEELVPFEREISVLVVRSAHELITYEPIETFQYEGQLQMAVGPVEAPGATEFATNVVSQLEGNGVFAVELFDMGNHYLLNEVAPRVHNSGHVTLNACRTSQFENHIRAITGLPLGDPSFTEKGQILNIIGLAGPSEPTIIGNTYWYGKEARPDRKTGHIYERISSL